MNFKNCKYVLGIDPSGSFHEGKGTTGYCLYNKETHRVVATGYIKAANYLTDAAYWQAHLDLIDGYTNHHKDVIISMEDYRLYAKQTNSQINSSFETIQLIGIIKMYCYTKDIPLCMRMAVVAKKRFTNEILLHKGYIKKDGRSYVLAGKSLSKTPLYEHELDAIRHAVYCGYFDKEDNCLWRR